MRGTFGTLLADRRAALLGRDAELGALCELLAPDGPLVAVVHGVAGAGKSSLLHAFEREAAARGARVVAVDGRAVQPTPAGFLAAVAAVLGCAGDAVHDALAEQPGRVVLSIDTAERLRLLDGWLRLTFLPSLPDNARVVLGTRDAPGAAWRVPFGELLRAIALGPLDPADACEVLQRAGLPEDRAAWVNGVVRGHPLSLRLAAAAVRDRPRDALDAVLPAVAHELAAVHLDGLDPETRRILDATAVLRRVTLSLLSAVLDEVRPQDAFEQLLGLPYVELGREGLVVHDTVREVVAALLRAADPLRWRALRTAAWKQIRRELESAAGPGRWSSIADMIHLVDEPLVREAFFPATIQHFAVEPASPADVDSILAIVARHEPPEQVELLRAWWEAMPGAFRVARHPRGDVVAFTLLLDPAQAPSRLLARDPLCGPWREHVRTDPVPRGQRILFARTTLAHATGDAASPCLAALLRDFERACLEAGPALRRVYGLGSSEDGLAQLAPLGWEVLGGDPGVVLGGVRYRTTVCDLGPDSIAGWISDLAARDLPVRDAALDADARELVFDGSRVSLTKLECDVLGYLTDREGQVVAREALLRDVWGYEWTGGSNVVEVAVSGLRRKLGARAAALETVRGVGYRFRGL